MSANAGPGAVGAARTRRTAGALAVLALLVYVLTGGGRIVGSDEVTMLELSRAMLRGGIAVPEGATLDGRDGRHYTKNAAAEAVIALPLTAAAEAAAGASGLPPARRALAVRFGVSFLNAIVSAIALGVFYAGARALGASALGALAASLLLGFTTPFWVYAKSFMAEPLQSLGLLGLVLGVAADDDDPGSSRRRARRSDRLAVAGAALAVAVKLSMLPLVLAASIPVIARPPRRWVAPALGVAVALVTHAVYDQARFGTPFETGYGAQATAAAYTTPLWVGLYGLLLSSGKGLAWFAPAAWLAPAGFRRMIACVPLAPASLPWSRWIARLGMATPRGRAAWSALLATLAALLLYGRFQHWAGDGSFGPRYLLPVLPLLFLPVAFALSPRPARVARTLGLALGMIGLLIQLGGVAIYFGAQMRDAGDYPYRLALEDPRFMSDSHFNPRFSPIAGHWRMALRNLGEHARGRWPTIGVGEGADRRLGIDPEDQRALLHALDFGLLYLVYAGFPRAPIVGVALVLAALVALAAWRLRAAHRAEAGAS